MTIELERRGSNAAAALDRVVAHAIDEAALDEMYAVIVGLRPQPVVVDAAIGARRSRWMVVLAVAATVLLLSTLALVLHERDRSPIQPPPGPDSTALTTTTSTAPDSVDEVTTHLDTTGPVLDGTTGGFLPYPPDVVGLPDGRVLRQVTGFCDADSFVVFDPAAGALTPLGLSDAARSNPAMVPLGDGRVLIAGGDSAPPGADNSCTFASVSTGVVLDAQTGLTVSAGPMVVPRWRPRGVLLPDGRVLVVDTLAALPMIGATTVAELYDPVTNRFIRTGDRTTSSPVTALYPQADGRVLVFGVQPEFYDPATGTFTSAGDDLPSPPEISARLPDGTVLAVFGHCDEVHTLGSEGFSESRDPVSTRIFDPATGLVRPGPDLPHCVESATVLPSGELLLTGFWWYAEPKRPDLPGGAEHGWAGVYDPATGTVQPVSMPNRRSPVGVLLPDGRVLLVGGVPLANTDMLAWADVYS